MTMRPNVDPKLWGPPAWAFLRYCAVACDNTCSESYRRFIELLPEVLPCEQCRVHSAAYIVDNPVDTNNLVKWIDRFQQAVSKRKAIEGADDGAPTVEVVAVPKKGGGCSNCAKGATAKFRIVLLVLGVLVACVALVLLVVGLVKLTKAD